MNRNDVTEMIIATKIQKGVKWSDVAKKIGLSKEWVTAGCLGQMTFDKKQSAEALAACAGLSSGSPCRSISTCPNMRHGTYPSKFQVSTRTI